MTNGDARSNEATSTATAKDRSPTQIKTFPSRESKKTNIQCKTHTKRKEILNVQKEGIAALYTIGKELSNQGKRGWVCEATKISSEPEASRQIYVVKQREKARYKLIEENWRYVMETILNTVNDNSHCLSIEEVLEDDTSFYIVTKRMQGGELYDFLSQATEVPMTEVKRILFEILLALKDLHSRGMIHRDVKPENILFEKHGQKLKLIDFDLCQPWSPSSPTSGKVVGTPGFIAPECLMGDFSPLSDIWSVGVIFYVMMVGDLPYSVHLTDDADCDAGSPKSRRAYRKICEQQVDWDEDPWPEFPDARDLCQRLLDVSTENRLQSADAALNHPFLTS